MWQAIVLGFLGGVVGGNALPHFLRGITKQRYPNALGNGPLTNLVSGWVGLVLAALLLRWGHDATHPVPFFVSLAFGLLLIGLFHAGPGAFGRRDSAS